MTYLQMDTSIPDSSIHRIHQWLHNFCESEILRRKIKKLFEISETRGRAGFERWLQFELMLFCAEKGLKIFIETKLNPKSLERTDITLEGFPEGKYAIELKIRRRFSYACAAFQDDFEKLKRLRQKTLPSHKGDDQFSYFAILLYGQSIGEEDVKEIKKNSGIRDFHHLNIGNDFSFWIAKV